MQTISREQLKNEIDELDTAYLGLLYNIIRQFPHTMPPATLAPSFSQRWRGQLLAPPATQIDQDTDPRLVYLAKRYQLYESAD